MWARCFFNVWWFQFRQRFTQQLILNIDSLIPYCLNVWIFFHSCVFFTPLPILCQTIYRFLQTVLSFSICDNSVLILFSSYSFSVSFWNLCSSLSLSLSLSLSCSDKTILSFFFVYCVPCPRWWRCLECLVSCLNSTKSSKKVFNLSLETYLLSIYVDI